MRHLRELPNLSRIGFGIVLAVAIAVLLPGAVAAEETKAPESTPSSKPAAKKKTPSRPTTEQLLRLINEQRALIDEQQKVIADQQAKIEEQQAKALAQEGAIEEQTKRLAELEQQLSEMNRRFDELVAQLPGLEEQKALEERLKSIEQKTDKVPELPPDVVSAGDFPGSIRVPGTDTAIKFGGRIRTAGVFTLAPLGSEDRFLTNSIPVEETDAAAGKGQRTTFSANTSRLNFEVRTPAGDTQMRAFIEGDFYGSGADEKRFNFRLRHAYAQFQGVLVGQTWSTFSDPAADHQDLDFEGINGENVIRQPQFRYTWRVREKLSVAAAAETPAVSLTDTTVDGIQVSKDGLNQVPDMVGRAVWGFKEIGHLQAAVVLRQIRGESYLQPDAVQSVLAWGASLSGVLPFRVLNLTDRFIFQMNFGKGNARYINDLNSLGGQDAVFDPAGELHALTAGGYYLDYEHQWKEWETAKKMKLRTSVIWSFVQVHNLDFQADNAYKKTNRFSLNVVFSPIDRIDVGVEYIYGTRENKDGHKGSSDQFQIVGIFRF